MRRPFARWFPIAAGLACLAAVPAQAEEKDKDADQAAEEPAVAVDGGQIEGLREFSTDRPDVTESPYTINPGHIQVETTLIGYSRSRRDAAGVVTDSFEFGTTNVRIGTTDNLELNLVWQPYGIVDPRRGGGPTERGIGSVTLRAKYNLWGNDGLDTPGDTALALLPYVTIPTDDTNGISDSEVGFGLIIPLAVELGGGFGLGLNAAADFTRPDRTTSYDAAFLTSASLAYAISDKLGTYGEVVWQFSRAGDGDIVTLNSGLTYVIGDNWQVDAGINVGVTQAADPIAPFIGISARF